MNWKDCIQQNMALNAQRAIADAKAELQETGNQDAFEEWLAKIQYSTPLLIEFVAGGRSGGKQLVETVGPPKIIRG